MEQEIQALKESIAACSGITLQAEYGLPSLRAIARLLEIANEIPAVGGRFWCDDGDEYDEEAFRYFMSPSSDPIDLDAETLTQFSVGSDGSWRVEGILPAQGPICAGSLVCFPNAQGIPEETAFSAAAALMRDIWRPSAPSASIPQQD